jgi:hypothetical protein
VGHVFSESVSILKFPQHPFGDPLRYRHYPAEEFVMRLSQLGVEKALHLLQEQKEQKTTLTKVKLKPQWKSG